MSATEELRRMLDERGMEHCDYRERTLWNNPNDASDWYSCSAIENFGGTLNVHTHAYGLTPSQAIAATLGAHSKAHSKSVKSLSDATLGDVPDSGSIEQGRETGRTTAFRHVSDVSDGVGSCKCCACESAIDPNDAYCRRCGAELVGTVYGSKAYTKFSDLYGILGKESEE